MLKGTRVQLSLNGVVTTGVLTGESHHSNYRCRVQGTVVWVHVNYFRVLPHTSKPPFDSLLMMGRKMLRNHGRAADQVEFLPDGDEWF